MAIDIPKAVFFVKGKKEAYDGPGNKKNKGKGEGRFKKRISFFKY